MKTLPSLLRTSAKNFPEHTALQIKNSTLTYSELNIFSNQLAQILLEWGVKKEEPVAILGEKGLETIAGLWGVLSAGACYVPLNPRDPLERQRKILQEGNIRFLFTTELFLSQSLELAGIGKKILVLNSSQTSALREQYTYQADLGVTIQEDQLAYILYTSGSTGQPKGVMIEHKAALAFIEWSCEAFAFHNKDLFLANAPLYFDLSTLDLFASAAMGATAVLVPDGYAAFPASLAKLLLESKANNLYLVPSILRLLTELNLEPLPAVRKVLFAGEVLSPSLLPTLYHLFPNARFWNLYGPTETNVCTYYELDKQKDYSSGIPLGKACPYAEIQMHTPQNIENFPSHYRELFVSGKSVMRGYFPSQKQLAPYQTGDLVSVEKGSLFFHGRTDDLIKIRSFRIEPAEIEAILYQYPGIACCAVVGLKKEETKIFAFVQGKEGIILSKEEILSHCRKNLPYYMIPAEIFYEKDLPLKSTGKIHRMQLLERIKNL